MSHVAMKCKVIYKGKAFVSQQLLVSRGFSYLNAKQSTLMLPIFTKTGILWLYLEFWNIASV